MSEELERAAVNHLLLQVARQHFTRLHTLMEAVGLYRGQPPLLHLLWKAEGCTQSDLAAAMHIQPATVTKMLQRMEQAGFVERRSDPDDQRISRVYLTEAGRAVRSGVQQREQQIEDEFMVGFTDEERVQLMGFLARIRDNLLRANTGRAECGLIGPDPE